MSGKIFISYRRDDSRADARSIYQFLQKAFGEDRLFIDVDSIDKGKDFRSAIASDLEDCAVMLVLIGNNWLDARTENGRRRLDEPNDYVRLEIASALSKSIPVIPILLDGAKMPLSSDLPDDLNQLAFRQSARVDHETFANDLSSIAKSLSGIVRPSRTKTLVGASIALLLLVGFATYWTLSQRSSVEPATDQSGKATTKRAFTSFEENTDMPGGDYASHRLQGSSPTQCQQMCSEDQRCLAWTYVAPGYQEETAVCWLKNQVPKGKRTDACCTSGVAYYRRPTTND